MKRIRRVIFALALIACVVSIALLLNFTAPNPTGRRYSSRAPLSTGQGSSGQIGLDAERVLADDLHLPRNDAPDQLKCVCNRPTYTDIANCRVCIVSAQLTAPYRRPDFVGSNFIAEAKNAQNLYYDSRDLGQITDYAMAARTLNWPLWVFTRVNTELDPEFTRIVRTTGGDVVPYFTVPGYVDPVDRAAQTSLGVSAAILLLMGLWELAAQRIAFAGPRTPRRATDPLRDAMAAIDRMENFTEQSKDHHRDKIG